MTADDAMVPSEKAQAYEDVEDIFQALFDGSMPVIVCGIKDGTKPFFVSNINDSQARQELLEHFVKKEKSIRENTQN